MALTLKLDDSDAGLVRRVLLALTRDKNICDKVVLRANVSAGAQANAALVRIANYIETVEKAG